MKVNLGNSKVDWLQVKNHWVQEAIASTCTPTLQE